MLSPSLKKGHIQKCWCYHVVPLIAVTATYAFGILVFSLWSAGSVENQITKKTDHIFRHQKSPASDAWLEINSGLWVGLGCVTTIESLNEVTKRYEGTQTGDLCHLGLRSAAALEWLG